LTITLHACSTSTARASAEADRWFRRLPRG
jgi:hypothetical protein